MPGGLEQVIIEVLEELDEGHRVIPEVRAYFQNRRAEQAVRRREQNRIAQAAHRRRKAQSSEVVMLTQDHKKERSPRTPLKKNKNNISSPAATISQVKDEQVLAQLTKVLSRESATDYVYHHRRIGKPIVPENVPAHCRLLLRHSKPDEAADRMVAGGWCSLPPPELLDAWAHRPRVGECRSAGHAPRGSKGAYPDASRTAPSVAPGRKRGRKPRGTPANGKRGKAAPSKDLDLARRLAIRDANRKKSLLPQELVDPVPDMPIGKYHPVDRAPFDRDAEDDLYNRSYRRHELCVRSFVMGY